MRERLAQILQERSMRPAQLAATTGLSTSTIDDIIKGNTNEDNIGVRKVLKIARTLGVTVEYLYYGDADYLDSTERSIVSVLQSMNDSGKEEVLKYTQYVFSQSQYKKYGEFGVVSKDA